MLKYLRELGSGSMGTTYLCEFKRNNQDKPVQFVTKRVVCTDDQFTYESVLRELTILSQVKHPHIVEYLSFTTSKNSWKFMLEYCPGGSLKTLLNQMRMKKMKLTLKHICLNLMDIASGLSYLHSRKILHKDLKPDNVLVDSKGKLKISDFGISEYFESHDEMVSDDPAGTPLYIAPEIYAGLGYGKKADVWSLGIITFEMAMLHHPYFNAYGFNFIVVNGLLAMGPFKMEGRDPSLQKLVNMMTTINVEHRCELDTIINQPCFAALKKDLDLEEKMYYRDLKTEFDFDATVLPDSDFMD